MRKFVSAGLSTIVFVFTCAFAGAKLALDWIGRVSAFEDIKEKDGYTAKALSWLFRTPTWVASLCLFVVVGAFLYHMRILVLRSDQKNRAPEELSQNNDLNSTSINKNKHLIVSSVFCKNHHESERYVFKTLKTIERAEIYVEYSTYYGMAGGGWTQPNRVHLESFPRVPKGERRSVNFIGLHSMQDQGAIKIFTKFGLRDENKHLIMKDQVYRCRITLLYGNDEEKHTYFILYMQNQDLGPLIFDQNLFSHSVEWEKVAEENVSSLFS